MMKGIQIFTDKEHNKIKKEVFKTAPMSSAAALEIADKPSLDDFKGIGTAITGSSCYILSKMDKDKRSEFLKLIYSKEGLGLSVARISVASCDYSMELYTYDDVENDVDLKYFSIDRDKKFIIPVIKEILEINPDIYIYASPWTPPAWMKVGGNLCGGYMRDEYLDCYAEYMVKFVKAYAAEGIKISALTIQNELDSQSGYSIPSCIWHPETEGEFICILRKKLDENNLDTDIWMHDFSFDGANRILWELENIDGLKDCCKGLAFHYYDGNIGQTIKIAEKFPNLEMHFTEGGPRLFDNYATDWCKWGVMISKVIKHGFKSMSAWNLILDDLGSPNMGQFFAGGLVTKDNLSGELSFSGQYKAFSHIMPYITKSSKFYPISVNREFAHTISMWPKFKINIEGFVIDNNDGKFVAVIVNPNEHKEQAQFMVNGELWRAELNADSINTIIIQ